MIADTFVGIFVPAATPAAVTAKLGSACAKVTTSTTFKTALKNMNQSTDYLDGRAFEAALQADEASKRKLIETSGIKEQ